MPAEKNGGKLHKPGALYLLHRRRLDQAQTPQQEEREYQWMCRAAQNSHDPDAAFAAYQCERRGIGTEVNCPAAKAHLLQAVELNQAAAMTEYAVLMLGGSEALDIEQDISAALHLLRTACRYGFYPAYYHLGRFLSDEDTDAAQRVGFSLLKTAAEKITHVPHPKYELGYSYYFGRGIEQDREKGYALVREVVEEFNEELPSALDFIGQAKIYGQGTQQDVEGGIEFLHKAQKQDFMLAWYHEGEYFYDQGDKEKAFRLFQVAQDDIPDAAFAVCLMTLNDEIAEPDYPFAIYQMKQLAEFGMVQAMVQLGMCQLSGVHTEKDQKAAFSWFRQAAEKGSAEAINMMGRCYIDGMGTEKNGHKAFECFTKAAQAGDPSAMFNLADCYAQGTGVHKDEKQAFEWYLKGAQKGLSIAQFAVGTCYFSGTGVRSDFKEALRWVKKAAEQDYGEAQWALASALLNSENSNPYTDAQAVVWLQRAVDNDETQAMVQLAICCMEGRGTPRDPQRGVHYFRKAAERGEPEAMLELATCYRTGQGISTDMEKAIYWVKRAADSKHPMALLALGYCYMDGEGGIERDPERALELYMEAVRSDVAEAYTAVGNYYFEVEENPKEAQDWFAKGSFKGDANATYMLGVCYMGGGEDENSNRTAFQCFRFAAVKENDEAQYMLGFCYLNGIGTDPNEENAHYWLRRAAKNGNEDAKELLLEYFFEEFDPEEDDEWF